MFKFLSQVLVRSSQRKEQSNQSVLATLAQHRTNTVTGPAHDTSARPESNSRFSRMNFVCNVYLSMDRPVMAQSLAPSRNSLLC